MVVRKTRGKNRGVDRRWARPLGYTLVELLIVMGVVLLLVAMLMPALAGLKERRKHFSAKAIFTNSGRRLPALPPTMRASFPAVTATGGAPTRRSKTGFKGRRSICRTAPAMGTLFKYVGQNAAVYRCPSLDASLHHPYGSNGYFDYTLFLSLTGARLANVRTTSRFTYPDLHTEIVRTPTLTEEDPWYSINRVSSTSGAHVGSNLLAHTHRGSCFYACVDGGVASFSEPAGSNANSWMSQSPGGKWTGLGSDVKWGWWNHQ